MAIPPGEIVEPQPAASVVLLRDAGDDLEILYLRRSPHLRFMGGYWVFPGGRIDPGDHQADDSDESGTARRAAVREAQEEAGVMLDPASLHPISRWTTPAVSPIRFATSFFVAESDHSPDANAQILTNTSCMGRPRCTTHRGKRHTATHNPSRLARQPPS